MRIITGDFQLCEVVSANIFPLCHVFVHNSNKNIYDSLLDLFFMRFFFLDIQVGCPLRCSFCATGKGGFSRNLKRHEIVEQVTHMSFPCPLCGGVFECFIYTILKPKWPN